MSEILNMQSLDPRNLPNIRPIEQLPAGHVVGALGTYSKAHPTHKSVCASAAFEERVVRDNVSERSREKFVSGRVDNAQKLADDRFIAQRRRRVKLHRQSAHDRGAVSRLPPPALPPVTPDRFALPTASNAESLSLGGTHTLDISRAQLPGDFSGDYKLSNRSEGSIGRRSPAAARSQRKSGLLSDNNRSKANIPAHLLHDVGRSDTVIGNYARSPLMWLSMSEEQWWGAR